MPERINNKESPYLKLQALVKVLREECPWDNEQTISTLRRYTLEEVHEVLEAIESAEQTGNWRPLKSELGDILYHIVFYCRIAEEQGQFDLDDVIDSLVDKMIYRHPHIFDSAHTGDLADQWNQLKDSEHSERNSLMDGIPPLPALKYAQKQQQRAARVGFDWNCTDDVMQKMREELSELEDEVSQHADKNRLEDEFGDVLFTLANLARKLDLDAELCLMSTNRKFDRRFRMMEHLAARDCKPMAGMDIDSLEKLYVTAKRLIDKESSR